MTPDDELAVAVAALASAPRADGAMAAGKAILDALVARRPPTERALAIAMTFAELGPIGVFRDQPWLDRIACFMLEHDPARGLALVRRALRAQSPVVVSRTASLLTAIDRPWTRRELTAALAADGQANARCRRALESALAGWQPPTDEERAVAPEDLYELDLLDTVDWHADEVAAIAARLRTILPDVF